MYTQKVFRGFDAFRFFFELTYCINIECHVEPTRVPLRPAAPSPPQLSDSLHRLASNNRIDHPIFYPDTLMKTGSESIEDIIRRRRISVAGFVARMEDTR